jgi:GTPase SAR1 family protein
MVPPLRNATFIVIVFDLSNRASFVEIKDYLEKARSAAPSNAKIVLVGNKSDIVETREIPRSQMYEYGTKIHAVETLEVSASTGEGVDVFRMMLAREACSAECVRRVPKDVELGMESEGCKC